MANHRRKGLTITLFRRNRGMSRREPAPAFLPDEVMVEILSRLPVKSLIRFRCVCKPWLSLFSNPNFAAMNLNRTSLNPQNYSFIFPSSSHKFGHRQLALFRNDSLQITISDLDAIINYETPFDPPKQFSFNWLGMVVVDSINGSVCLVILESLRSSYGILQSSS